MKYLKTLFMSRSRKLLLVIDAAIMLICLSLFEIYALRTNVPVSVLALAAQLFVTLLLMVGAGTYQGVGTELITVSRCVIAVSGGAVAVLTADSLIRGADARVWAGTLVPTLTAIVLMIFARAIYQFYVHEYRRSAEKEFKKPCLIVGAGNAAGILIKEFSGKDAQYYPKCLVDDDPRKVGTVLYGVPVKGKIADIPNIVIDEKINTIIIAIPSAEPSRMAEIVDICSATRCFVKKLPNISEIVERGAASLGGAVRSISMDELLGREPISVDVTKVRELISGRVCLVTGGGGSIGSELCRQIMKLGPGLLVIVDIYENNAYDIQQELILEYGDGLPLRVEIASVRDREKLDVIFARYKPELVFHAAAHKHVLLMEHSAEEAVKNNVGGTCNLAELSIKYGVRRFLLISTDKAVNPTNVMGASKRCCERVIKYFSEKGSDTVFVTVRFGNVLGSNGSVVPLFERQILKGGPVTITHPDITRYFMTIPEAVSLVLQAETMAESGQIFVLNMGKPVKIVRLAENLIKLHGCAPYKDVDIRFVGLREGEKLFEELRLDEEEVLPTYNDKINIGSHIALPDDFEAQLNKLLQLAAANDSEGVVAQLKVLCPTFQPDKRVHGAK